MATFYEIMIELNENNHDYHFARSDSGWPLYLFFEQSNGNYPVFPLDCSDYNIELVVNKAFLTNKPPIWVITPKLAKGVIVYEIRMADDQWSNQENGNIMKNIARQKLSIVHKRHPGYLVFVRVYEHAGWYLTYMYDEKTQDVIVVNSANDMAQYSPHIEQIRNFAYYCQWQLVETTKIPPIEERDKCNSVLSGKGVLYHCIELDCPVHGERNKNIFNSKTCTSPFDNKDGTCTDIECPVHGDSPKNEGDLNYDED